MPAVAEQLESTKTILSLTFRKSIEKSNLPHHLQQIRAIGYRILGTYEIFTDCKYISGLLGIQILEKNNNHQVTFGGSAWEKNCSKTSQVR